MTAGLGHLGLPPSIFWTMTLRELDAALRGRFGSSSFTRTALTDLMRNHPD